MFRNLVRTLLGVAFAACALALPAQALAAPPSEKAAGLWQSMPIVSEKLAGLAPEPSTPLVSEKVGGLWSGPPTGLALGETPGDFNWTDAGIGAGAALGFMLIAAAGTLTVRRRRTSLAH